MKSLFAKNKRGQTLDLISGTVVGFMVLIFIVFAVLFGISALNPTAFFTSGSAEANATGQLQANLTSGVAQFGKYIPTVMLVLGVVLVMSAIVLLILYIRRTQGATGSAGGL
jgi:Na+-transporting methylmalonyl-CoA/oxaloacetate decarboxylase gamma subunit